MPVKAFALTGRRLQPSRSPAIQRRHGLER
jgi:hypothetical protein